MYYFFLDKLMLPVAPSALSTKINGQNKTINLINDGEVNILKLPGLTEVSFEFMVPHTKYPFVTYGAGGILGATAIFAYLDCLKLQPKPFQFIVARMGSGFKMYHATNLKVTLESYSIEENAEYGLDQMVSVTLKQYRPYSTKILKVDKNGKATAQRTRG